VTAAREKLGWAHPPFEIPDAILATWRGFGARGAPARAAWRDTLKDSPKRVEFEAAVAGALPEGWGDKIEAFKRKLAEDAPTVATRKASQMALEVINAAVPNTIGGSADLTGSNNTKTADMTPLTAQDYAGRYIYYGVREHAMAAVMNGLALHRGVIPYGATFLVFTDYARPAIRLSALMGLRVVYVMTHDSIGLGEDGPTHQPVEHVAALRAIPNLAVFRPADAVETAECWALALERGTGPSVLALTRQGLAPVRTTHVHENMCARGAYEVAAADGAARVSLIATGSEVGLALAARERLQADGIPSRVVSMPCWELFAEKDPATRASVLGEGTLKVGIEAAVSMGWERWLGDDGLFVGMDGFGASAPAKDLYKHFGLTPEDVVKAVKDRL
jgi:transketolase